VLVSNFKLRYITAQCDICIPPEHRQIKDASIDSCTSLRPNVTNDRGW